MPSIRALGNSFLSASSGSSPLPTAPLDQQTAVSPNQGPMSGGTRVTIIGHHLSGATSVHFGSQEAWSFTVPNDTTIIAVSPAGAGNVPVTVTTAGGTGTLGWFFYQPVPGLKSLQPASGPVGGGSVVVLTGSNLDTVQSVRFGSALAVPTEVTNQRLTVVAPPASAPGTVPVTVTTAGGVSNAAPYTYTAEPIITGVFPATGGTAGGIPVLITGSGLARVTAVTIAGVPVSSFRANSDTLIVAVVPPGAAGAADVTVTTPGGSSTLHGAYVYTVPTSVTVSTSPDASVTGQEVTFTATVVPTVTDLGAPTGTMTFDFGDGTAAVTVPVTDGTAATTHTYTSASGGPYTVTASYSDHGTFGPSTGTTSHTVGRAGTTTSLTSTPEPSAVGQEVTCVARVTADPPGAGSPTGSVTFDFGDGSPPVTAAVVNHLATVVHSFTSTGGSPYQITAAYNGDADFQPSGSPVDAHAVSADISATVTTLVSSPNPSSVGQSVTFTASVAPVPPAAGSPTGTVLFLFRDGASATVPLGADGTATTTHAYATAGGSPFDVLAVYSGDADFSSSSAGDTHTVDPAATTTALTTASPAVTGQTVTLTATVTAVAPGAPTPTGTVTFSFGDGSPSITTALTAGVATTTHAYASASGSPYTVTAVYNGNTDFAGSTATGTQTVDPAATTIGVSTSPAPSTVGQPITVTAVVVPVAAGAGTPSGTVSFSFGDGTPSVTVPVNAGVAVAAHTYLSTSGSPYAITATYNDDAGYTGSSRSITQTVGRTPTVTAVTAAPAPSAVGQPMTATVTVGALPPGSGAPTGTVTVDFGDGTTPVVAPLAGATAVLTHTYAHAIGGPYVITASYGGDGDFGSSQTTVIQTVIRASTTLSLAGAPDPSVVGEPVTFTATVAPSAGTGAATGTVRFDFGDNTPPADAPLVSGVATVQHVYASASGSPYAVTAVYGGDGDFTGSAGHTTQTVGRASTVTSVSTSPNPSLPGEQVTVTATVAPVPLDAGSPTGSVTFDFGDGTSGVTAPVTGGVATASHTYTTTTGSPRAVIAVYGGDGDFTGSAGHTTQTVGRASSVTTVSTSPDPSVTGQQVTVTAVIGPVAPAAGAPTGTVTFDFGDGTAAVSVPVTDGTAATTHTYVSASGGPHTVTAAYDGDFDFAPSTGTTSHTVGRAGTTTSLTSTPEPSAVGQEVTCVARVTADPPGAGSPTGSVTFDFGDGSPPVTAAVVNHLATVVHSFTSTGGSPYQITAAYNGDADFQPSGSPVDAHAVSADISATVTTLVSSPNPSSVGQSVTFTASVAPVPPAAGSPTGTVLFLFRDGASATVPLGADGTATTTHAYATAGGSPFDVLAVYSGDADFSSSSADTAQTVNPATTTTSVAAGTGTSVSGRPVTVTATVGVVAPGAGTPTGTVTFVFGDGSPSVTVPVASGTATTVHTWTSVAGSPYTVTATYNGEAAFTGSSGTATATVNRAATTTTVASSPKPSVPGRPVTVTATVGVVAPGAGTPTGTVTFVFGDGSPSVTVPVASGAATTVHTWTSVAGSPYTVTATYNGDSDTNPSSATSAQTVTAAVTKTAVATSPNPSLTGQTVTATATVAAVPPGAGTPTGTVVFDFGDGAVLTASLSGGTATATHAYAGRAGSPFVVNAVYGGNSDFAASSAATAQTVSQTATTVAATASANPSVTGQPVTFTATVAAVAPGAGTPTGTVTFSFGDGTPAVTAPVFSGTATVNHAYASVSGSPYRVTAAYNGDTGYTPSTTARTQTVLPAATSTAVSASPNPATHTQPVTVTVTVAPVSPGGGTPTGTVTVAVSGEKAQTVPLVSGTASVGYTRLNKAVHTIDVTYSGDTNYSPSSATGTETVT